MGAPRDAAAPRGPRFHQWEVRRRARRPSVREAEPDRWPRHRPSGALLTKRRRRCGRCGTRGVRGGGMAPHGSEGAQAGAVALRRAHSRRSRAPCDARDARRRQAHQQLRRRGRTEGGGHHRLLRRVRRQALRRSRTDRPGRSRADSPRAAGGGGGRRSLELPAHHHGLEARSRAAHRQLSRAQARRAEPALRDSPGRTRRRGGLAAGGAQRRARIR